MRGLLTEAASEASRQGEMDPRIAAAREAQAHWRSVPVADRLEVIRSVRALIAREGAALAEAAGGGRGRPLPETLTAEVIPLAAACQYLEVNAARILRTRRVGRHGRPVWLAGVRSEVRREPWGLVLIVGPANYPLFLPGVQLLQALAAGNAVLVKPGRQGTAAVLALAALLQEAGLPRHLLQVLPEPPSEVYTALEAGVDLVLFTGSTAAGRQVLQAAAAHTIPVIAELSGEDPVLVRADADAALVERALRFARDLNAGESCIVPRRVQAPASAVERLRKALPGLPIQSVIDDCEALHRANQSAFALGATIFSRDEVAALRLAELVQAGVVVINDCIMPTADPRLPFGGRGASGYGTTRGPEGLLALTRPKVISLQRGVRRHLQPAHADDAAFFLAYLQAAHGRGWRHRWRWGLRLLRLGKARSSS